MKDKFWKVIAIVAVIGLYLLAFAELVEVETALNRLLGL